MKKILTVVRKEYLERVRSKSFVIATVLGPALMSLFIVMPMLLSETGKDKERMVGLVDPAGRWLQPLSETIEKMELGNVRLRAVGTAEQPTDQRLAEMKEKIQAGELHSGVVLGPDFLHDPQAIYYNQSVSSMVVRNEVLRPALNQVLREARFHEKDVSQELFRYLFVGSQWQSIVITDEGEQEQDDNVSFGMAFVLIMIIYIMVIMYGNHTLTAVIEEKRGPDAGQDSGHRRCGADAVRHLDGGLLRPEPAGR
ncbi:hypothetical protein CSA17_06560 [bacterium DOLJORAL78_65_58]|nr:MAG: hypothetical protein CSA17_06560 [bacterium DOLJORAL78_65_58]